MRAAPALLLVLALALGCAAPVRAEASTYDAGVLAYDRGAYEEALGTFHRLAARGNPEAEFMLGAMYFYGKGVQRDDALAAIWFHKAALKGNANAQLALGSLHISGMGVRQDLVQAYTWLTVAADGGVPALRQQAIALREEASRLMQPSEIEAAQRRAADYEAKRSGLTSD